MHEVTFKDQVEPRGTLVYTEHHVLSYKSYNAKEWYQIEDLKREV